MAGQDQGGSESAAEFMARRRREVAAAASARAEAHQTYGWNLRNGQTLDLRQPGDLAAYGSRLSLQPSSNASPPPPDEPAVAKGSWKFPEPVLQVNAALRSASNAATFGQADKFAAAMDALTGHGGLNGLGQRYDANLQRELAQDRYNATYRPLANSVGSLGGGVLGLLALGPEEAGAAAAPRLAGAAKLTAKEVGAILAGGGLLGFGSQKLSDIATGHHSSAGDTAGAIAGGIAGAAAFPFGPTRAGAVDGAVTSAAQDLFNGRPVDFPQLAQSAMGGGLLAGHVGSASRKLSDGLSKEAKGQLGEVLGDVRGFVNGDGRMRLPKKRAPVAPGKAKTNCKGSYWYPDATEGPIPEDWSGPLPKMFEDKFGYGASLSKNQMLAQSLLKSKFQLNHFTPSDVGMMTAFPFLSVAPQAVRQDQGQ